MGVKVGSAVGSTNFQQEQKELVAPLEDWERDLVAGGARGITGEGGANITHKCLVHVVVATPDRLKDHMMHTPAFDLRHLRSVLGAHDAKILYLPHTLPVLPGKEYFRLPDL